MKWGIEHLRVTLRDDSGETVVIEQSKDGAIRCEQANGAPQTIAAEPAANRHEARTASTAAARAQEEPEPRARSPRRAQARKNKPRTAREPRPEATPEKPYLSLRLDIDPEQIASLLLDTGGQTARPGIASARLRRRRRPGRRPARPRRRLPAAAPARR